jgi:HTH-type transcriptional regulator, glycine betaine synthesis regulator
MLVEKECGLGTRKPEPRTQRPADGISDESGNREKLCGQKCLNTQGNVAYSNSMRLATMKNGPLADRNKRSPAKPLNALEVEIIDLFVQFSHILGQPKSVAEIYGLLFAATRPLSMEEMMERLNMSKGSTSQGLRFLRNLGAVKPVYVPAQRATHFEAVAQLRNLATRFLRDQILTRLDSSLDRIDQMAALVQDLPAEEREPVRARVGMLQSWQKKTRKVLPIVMKILGAEREHDFGS